VTIGPLRARLADGREILYFDDDDHPGRSHDASDQRPLDAVTTDSQLRWDPLAREWTVLAAHRQGRTYHPPADLCPLCPTHGDRHTEVPEPAYDVVVFENRFPSLAGVADRRRDAPSPNDPATELCAPGTGRCEVIVPTDDHEATLPQLSVARIRTLVDVWAHRSDELRRRDDVAVVGLFENRGDAVGVTLHHTHQQLYGYPFVPARTSRLLAAARDHRGRTGRCLVCDRLDMERSDGTRIVSAGDHWTFLVPYAARWPYEVHAVPHRHVRGLPDLDDAERDELASLWRDLFARYDGLFDVDRLPTIAAWHQTPSFEPDGHVYGQAFTLQRDVGKLKFLAGSESSFGAWILDVTPEQAAEALRD